MSFITVNNYEDAKGHTITVKNRMNDVPNGLGIKNISDLLRKEIQGIFQTKDITKEQKKKYIRTKKKRRV